MRWLGGLLRTGSSQTHLPGRGHLASAARDARTCNRLTLTVLNPNGAPCVQRTFDLKWPLVASTAMVLDQERLGALPSEMDRLVVLHTQDGRLLTSRPKNHHRLVVGCRPAVDFDKLGNKPPVRRRLPA